MTNDFANTQMPLFLVASSGSAQFHGRAPVAGWNALRYSNRLPKSGENAMLPTTEAGLLTK